MKMPTRRCCAYLDRADAALRENPDKAEILADLEQAIADKCARFLGPGKTVVLKSEIDQIIVEMGPVEGGERSPAGQSDEPRGTADQAKPEAGAPKRLYRIKEGAMIAGVCAGLAAYFHMDVTLVRVLFVIGTFITSGAAILAYFVMMMVIPEANTSGEHAAAYGLPFNAQEIVDRATKFAKGNQAWRRQWRRKQRQFRREWQREWRSALDDQPRWRADDIPGAIFVGAMVPIFFVINAALFVAFWFAIYSLATTGVILGWTIPAGMPFWVAVADPLRPLHHHHLPALSRAASVVSRLRTLPGVRDLEWPDLAHRGRSPALVWLATSNGDSRLRSEPSGDVARHLGKPAGALRPEAST